ncbi:unnamed protein product [Cylindrotheca closterium]|uniref:Uncharacterized protein n=1 Tax=Cylindrotheca closterium TaxID=2856 RepID=A0AAD2FP46_9STRA|nr:unnamed protein product [Cylindrotheca closterium]
MLLILVYLHLLFLLLDLSNQYTLVTPEHTPQLPWLILRLHSLLRNASGNPPTYKEVNALDIANFRNATKVSSPNRGGQLGHVGLTMTAPDYALISPTAAWVNPIPPAPTFTTQHNVSLALKKLIDNAVPNEYLDKIRHPYLNLLPISIPNIFAHLYQQPSSNVTPEAIEERRLSIERQKYSIDEELTTYFKRLQDYQTFAAQGGEEVTDNNLMTIAVRHIRATKHFNQDCQDWNARAADTKTWTLLKAFFQQAQCKLPSRQPTSHPTAMISAIMA